MRRPAFVAAVPVGAATVGPGILLLAACGAGAGPAAKGTGVADDCAALHRYGRDADGDGFGDPSDIRLGCTAPEGYVADESDCDDVDPTTFPGAEEPCGSERDHNCDGFTRTERVVAVAVADWTGGSPGEAIGGAMGRVVGEEGSLPATDWTDPGTGLGALRTLAEADDTAAGGLGAVVLAGSPDVPLVDIVWIRGEVAGPADAPTEGVVVADYHDALGADTGGAVFVFDTSTGAWPRAATDATVGWSLDVDEGFFGATVDVGDLDGDDAPEVIVGTTYTDDPPVWILSPRDTGRHRPDEVGIPIAGEEGDAAGVETVAFLGDVDGDGVGDLGAGASLALGYRGRAYVLTGPFGDGRGLADADLRLDGEAANGLLGRGLAGAADVDGDGRADVAVGAPGQATSSGGVGAVWVFPGTLPAGSTLADAPRSYEGATAGGRFGGDLALVTTAEAEVALVVRDQGGGENDAGELTVFTCLLPGRWGAADAAAVLYGPADASGGLGFGLAGDLDGDGGEDLLLGASLAVGGRGRVDLFSSSAW